MTKKSVIEIFSLLIIITLSWIAISDVDKTSAFFTSSANVFNNVYQSGNLDLEIKSETSFATTTPGEANKLEKKVEISNIGNIDFQYKITTESIVNCSDYEIEASNTDGIECGISGLNDFECFTTSTVGDSDEWKFTLTKPESCSGTCRFNIVFDSWQVNLSPGEGFSDREIVNNEIIDPASPQDSPVVLNEFLPNPYEFPHEYIELYNKHESQDIDLSNYYIIVDGNTRIDFSTTTLSQYAGKSTVITSEGWLALTTPTNQDLGDSGGTIKLYNPEGLLLDEITYPLEGASSSIPADKSFARIPDGTGGWVDPYPTPGGPNKPDVTEKKSVTTFSATKTFTTTTTEEIVTSKATSTESNINEKGNATSTSDSEKATTTLNNATTTQDITDTSSSSDSNTEVVTSTVESNTTSSSSFATSTEDNSEDNNEGDESEESNTTLISEKATTTLDNSTTTQDTDEEESSDSDSSDNEVVNSTVESTTSISNTDDGSEKNKEGNEEDNINNENEDKKEENNKESNVNDENKEEESDNGEEGKIEESTEDSNNNEEDE